MARAAYYGGGPTNPQPVTGNGGADWVPADAKIHIDLVGGSPQGRAWVNGVGEVAVDTLLGSDPDTDNGWGSTGYDPAGLTINGYDSAQTTNGFPVALIGVAKAKVLDATTVVIKSKTITDAVSNPLVLLSADGNDALETDLRQIGSPIDLIFYSWAQSAAYYVHLVPVNIGAGSVNKTALTIMSSRFDGAINGGTAIAGDVVVHPGNLVAAVVDFHAGHAYLQSITLYDPLPSTAGLSELSAVS